MDIVLCDDHEMVMESMASLFRAHGHQVTGTTDHPSHLAKLVAANEPDVCVTDLLFPGEDEPDDALGAIAEVSSHTDVVVLTGVAVPGDLEAARRAGASAVGSKALPSAEILALVEGRSDTVDRRAPNHSGRGPFFLTDREVEVLQCLGNGHSTARMAALLGLRQATARSHVQSLLLKLGVHSRLAAVAVGVRNGLIDVES